SSVGVTCSKSLKNRPSGGEDGIRTHETLLRSTPLAGERLRPLGHLSIVRWIKKRLDTINWYSLPVSIKAPNQAYGRPESCGDLRAVAARSRKLTICSGSVPVSRRGGCPWPGTTRASSEGWRRRI